MRLIGHTTQRALSLTAGLLALTLAGPSFGEIDRSRYMSPDEVRPGMKGYGRTVMSGSKIETFGVEVIGVMRNAYYARQDVILVRCSGLNLEHSGIIAGMSGSPCYIRDDNGRERMIGAVAFGWTYNKDPVCGVQPITQMLPIPDIRMPQTQPADDTVPTSAPVASTEGGTGLPLGELVARVSDEPVDKASKFSIFNDDISRGAARRMVEKKNFLAEGLQPLGMPVTVSSNNPHTLALLRSRFERFGMTLASGGAAGQASQAEPVRLEPGSAICIPFMTGDLIMQGLGTCTEMIGDRVLGFGHAMFGEGAVELPMSTGVVHTVISSVARSEKVGAALDVVGTLWGDENSGIFGVRGRTPAMIPLEVVIHDIRGEQTYHYNIVQEPNFTPSMLGSGVVESIYAHSNPPKEHTIRYAIEAEFNNLGAFRTSNMSSQSGTGAITGDTVLPVSTLMDTPFGKAKLVRARVEVTIDKGARVAMMDQVQLPRTVYKPGATVNARVRWLHEYSKPQYNYSDYTLKLPADLLDGDYELTVGSSTARLLAMRSEKPHLFRADSLAEALKAMNMMGSLADNRVYMYLSVPRGGVAVENLEMPDLPSYQQQILLASKRSDVQKFTSSVVAQHETDFVVKGSRSFKITISRRADQ